MPEDYMSTNENEEYINDIKYLEDVLRHVQLVQQNCLVLAKKFIEEGNSLLGRTLVQNSMSHDASKLIGMEWQCMKLHSEKTRLNKSEQQLLAQAVQHHSFTNEHHPEHWGTIHDMPEIYLIEMVCDWKARATEFGTDLRKWIEDDATKRFAFKKSDDVYDRIAQYVDMLCGPPLEKITK
jgi:hypothetical protein